MPAASKAGTLAQSARSCAFRLTGSGPRPKQDEGSHWRRRPTRLGLNHSRPPDVSTGKEASGGLGLCWSVCGGDDPPSALAPPPARRPLGAASTQSRRDHPTPACGSSQRFGGRFASTAGSRRAACLPFALHHGRAKRERIAAAVSANRTLQSASGTPCRVRSVATVSFPRQGLPLTASSLDVHSARSGSASDAWAQLRRRGRSQSVNDSQKRGGGLAVRPRR